MYVAVDFGTFRALPEPYPQQRMSEERRMEAMARRVAERNSWLRGLLRAPYCGVSMLLCTLRL
jgi:hypothetical protein